MVAAKKPGSSVAPPPVCAITGNDDFLMRQAMRGLLRDALGDDPDDMAIVDFDGPNAIATDVLDECRTLSMMAPMKVVRLRDADPFITANRPLLEKYVESPSSSTVLVLVSRKMKSNERLAKAIDKQGGLIRCETPGMKELPGWVAQQAKSEHGVSLDSAASRRLIELIGDNLGRLDMELAKLATYAAPRTNIGAKDVEELVGASRAENIFRIMDAISRRDAATALAQWNQMIALDRGTPYMAVGGLAWSFRNLVEVKRRVSAGMSVFDACRSVRMFADPGVVKRQLDSFSLDEWENQLLRLLRIDIGAKSGLGDVDVAVEKLIVSLCAPSAAHLN